MGWIDQSVPVDCSVSARSGGGLPAPVDSAPTAVQAVAVRQDTPDRELPVAPAGLSVVCATQLLPFQPWARVTFVPEPFV